MRQLQTFLALALLLFAGVNCGTESPVQESVVPPVVEVPAGTVQGEVQAVDGVVVQVRLLRDGELLMQVETEATYELASVEPGDYTVQISAKGYETEVLEVTVASGQVLSLDKVTLVALETPVSHLHGMLTDEATGDALGEVNLQLRIEGGEVYEGLTTEAGVFTFENLPVDQAFTLAIEHDGYEALEVTVGPIPAGETLEVPVHLMRMPEVEQLRPGQGLSLESEAPLFELTDGGGKLHALGDYIGKQNVVLVFYRGGW